MDIDWDGVYINPYTLALDPHGIDIPTYGKYGGPHFAEGDVGGVAHNPIPRGEQPIDALDTLFYQHDLAADGIVADRALLNGMVRLSDRQMDAEAHLYAGLAEFGVMQRLTAEGYHFSFVELARDIREAAHDLAIGLAGVGRAERLAFANWAAHTGGKLLV